MNTPPAAPADAAALRAEHDALGERLTARESIRISRIAIYEIFAGLIAMGFTIAFAWDRYGPLKPGVVRKIQPGPPLFMYLAMAVTVILLTLSIRSFARARRLMLEEDRLRARYLELRTALRLDA